MKAKAFYWASANFISPKVKETRNTIVKFTNLLSEYSNLIESRADAIIQQKKNGVDRQNLPLSVFLRDSGATGFQSLLKWQDAGGMTPEKYCGTRVGNFLICQKEALDRVRAVELLFADYNWSNINSVYASGRGDVGMVFVKDDIGNWDLKSFDNDLSKLVEAYSDVAKAALELAVDAAKNATTAGGAEAAQVAFASGDSCNWWGFGCYR